MNIAKRAKAIVEHDRAEMECERLHNEMQANAKRGCVTLFAKDCERWESARRWLGWAKRQMLRHGAWQSD